MAKRGGLMSSEEKELLKEILQELRQINSTLNTGVAVIYG